MFNNQFIAFPFFTLFALANAYWVIKVKKIEQVLLAAAIISAPWAGGVWIKPVKFDFRLTYIFLLAAFVMILSKKTRFKNKISPFITGGLFALIIWSIIGATQAFDPAIAFGDGTITMFFNFLFLYTIIKIAGNKADIDFITKSVFLALFYTTILAVLQYKVRFFHVGFVDGKFSTFMWWRTRSTFHHANGYGMYLMLVIPFVFRQAILMLKLKDKKLARNYIIVFLLACFSLFTTQNRGGWLGLAFGMSATIFIDFFRKGAKKTRKIMIRVLVSLLFLSLFPLARYGPRMYDRLFEGKDSFVNKADSRAEYNIDAWNQVEKHPILGCGVSNVRYYSRIIFTHNLYLLMLSETGYPGLVMFCLYMLGLTLTAIKGMRSKNFFVSTMGMSLLSTLLGLFVASVPGPDFGITTQVSSQLWILAGIVVSLIGMDERMIKQQKLLKRKQMFQQQQQQQNAPVNGNGTSKYPTGLKPQPA